MLMLTIDCKSSGRLSKTRDVSKVCVCACVCLCRWCNTPVIVRCDVIQIVLTPHLEVLCVCVGTPVCCKCWQLKTSKRYDTAVLQNCSKWPFVKSRNWSTNCETQYWSTPVQSTLPHTQHYKFHFNNILHYAQYPNCSISIIPCTTHSTPTAPFQ